MPKQNKTTAPDEMMIVQHCVTLYDMNNVNNVKLRKVFVRQSEVQALIPGFRIGIPSPKFASM